MKPSWASSSWRRSAAIATIRSSGTRSPASMYSLAFLPSSVSSLTLARSMSPVEMNGSWKSDRRRSACVPLPAPGGPKRMRFSCWAIGLITVSVAMNSWDRGGLLDMSNSPDSALVAALTPSVGAYVMGRRMFGGGEGAWDPEWRGGWGADPPYHAPVFVLTHHEREPLEMEGGTRFEFVTGGVAVALGQAQAAAGD